MNKYFTKPGAGPTWDELQPGEQNLLKVAGCDICNPVGWNAETRGNGAVINGTSSDPAVYLSAAVAGGITGAWTSGYELLQMGITQAGNWLTAQSISLLTTIGGILGIGADSEAQAQATLNDGITVIGRFPANRDLAQTIGGSWMDIGSDEWNAMTDDERWANNVQFLQDAIIRGDTFRLASSPSDAQPGTFFLRELIWLAEQGYTTTSNGRYMFHP